MNDPVPAPVRALIELYSRDLPQVRFPDVDAESLSGAASALQARTAAVAQAAAALEAAKQAEAEAAEQLLVRARRALAYVKVYAEDKPEIMAKLESIALKAQRGRAEAPAKPKAAPEAAPRARVPEIKAEIKAEVKPAAPATRALLQAASAEAPKGKRAPKGAKNGHAEAR